MIEDRVHSRRRVLIAALGASVASLLGRPPSTRAADGDPLVLGTDNQATAATWIHIDSNTLIGLNSPNALVEATSSSPVAMRAAATSTGGKGLHAMGSLGVHAYGEVNAVYAEGGPGASSTIHATNVAPGGAGIKAEAASDGAGVYGTTAYGADNATGVWGEGPSSGVQGTSHSGGVGIAGLSLSGGATAYGDPRISNRPTKTGVYGQTINAGSNAYGVAGWADQGAGVVGTTANGSGIFGFCGSGGSTWPNAPANTGIAGYSNGTSGIGVLASSTAGRALQVTGKAAFSRSGRTSVAANRSYVDVDLSAKGGLAGTPLCFANLMTYRSGVYVAAVRPNYPSTGKLRIYLNRVASTTASTTVAWIVMG